MSKHLPSSCSSNGLSSGIKYLVSERLHAKIHLTQNFTTIVTGHGNIKAYLYRFKIIEAPNCPCGNDNQTAEHILLERAILKEDRERLIAAVAKADNWPIKKKKCS